MGVLIRQRPNELRRRHLAHGLLEGRRAAVMKIGRRRRDVAQARYSHNLGFPRYERTEDSLPLEEIAADVDTLMARAAAERFEQLIAAQFLRRKRRRIAAEPAVEPASRRKQRSLKGRQGVQKVGAIRPPPAAP